MGFPRGAVIKNPPADAGDERDNGFNPWVGKVPQRWKWQPNSSILAWKVPWTEETGKLRRVHGVSKSWT